MIGSVTLRGSLIIFIVSCPGALVLGVELCLNDKDYVRRVGTRILARRATREQRIRAARVRHGFTTDMFDIPGNPCKVYFNEHPTKPNRILHSKTRAVGKEWSFKFVWTKDEPIYMHRSDTSSLLWVTSEATLNKLTREQEIIKSPCSPQNPGLLLTNIIWHTCFIYPYNNDCSYFYHKWCMLRIQTRSDQKIYYTKGLIMTNLRPKHQ